LDAGSFVVELFLQETSASLTAERVRQKVVGIVAAVAFCPCARRFSPESKALTVYLTNWDWLSQRNVRLHRSTESGNVPLRQATVHKQKSDACDRPSDKVSKSSANDRYLRILLKNSNFGVDHNSEDRWQPRWKIP
jgi:hypothetical protein